MEGWEPTEPTHEDPLAGALSDRFGGPSGEHGGVRPDGTPGGHWWWTPLRIVLAVVTLTFSLSLIHEKPCIGSDWGNDAVRYSKACYSDIPYLYTSHGFVTQQWPYSNHDRYERMEYPVGISYFAWAVSEVVPFTSVGPLTEITNATSPDQLWSLPGMTTEVSVYFVITAVCLFGFVLAAAYFMTRANPKRPWDGLIFAASPVLAAAALVNWDLLAVAASAGALWAWGRRKPIWTGIFIGLGISFKLYPLLLLGGVIALALRDRSKIRGAMITTLATAISWTLLQVPAWLGNWDSWTYFWHFNSTRGADWGSLWLAAQYYGATYTAHQINVIQWVAMALICAGVAALAKWAPNKPSLAQLGYLLTAGFLITNKVYSPQYVLWLLPLAVLARPKLRDQIIWQAGELFYFFMIWWNLGGYLDVNVWNTNGVYSIGIFVRVAVEMYLVVMILRDLLLKSDGSTDEPDDGDAVVAGHQRELMA